MTDPNTAPQGCSRSSVIAVTIVLVVTICLVAPAIQQARETARRTQSRNNLKLIGLALHNYHDNYDQFPPGGVFDQDGMGYHGWTSSLLAYLDVTPWYNQINFNIPWDDPRQVDLFRDLVRTQSHYWLNPSSTAPARRSDGLVLNHYAGNQSIFYRNSSVGLHRHGVHSGQLLVADALDRHMPLGCPYAWRDVTLGFMADPEGFGCRPRNMTQCLMADGTVREIAGEADSAVIKAMAGEPKHFPTVEQVAKPREYPLIEVSRIWRVEWLGRDKSKDRPYIRWTSPTGEVVTD